MPAGRRFLPSSAHMNDRTKSDTWRSAAQTQQRQQQRAAKCIQRCLTTTCSHTSSPLPRILLSHTLPTFATPPHAAQTDRLIMPIVPDSANCARHASATSCVSRLGMFPRPCLWAAIAQSRFCTLAAGRSGGEGFRRSRAPVCISACTRQCNWC